MYVIDKQAKQFDDVTVTSSNMKEHKAEVHGTFTHRAGMHGAGQGGAAYHNGGVPGAGRGGCRAVGQGSESELVGSPIIVIPFAKFHVKFWAFLWNVAFQVNLHTSNIYVELVFCSRGTAIATSGTLQYSPGRYTYLKLMSNVNVELF